MEKGTCEYCSKETRSFATKICNHCYSLRVMMTSNLTKSRLILEKLEKEDNKELSEYEVVLRLMKLKFYK